MYRYLGNLHPQHALPIFHLNLDVGSTNILFCPKTSMSVVRSISAHLWHPNSITYSDYSRFSIPVAFWRTTAWLCLSYVHMSSPRYLSPGGCDLSFVQLSITTLVQSRQIYKCHLPVHNSSCYVKISTHSIPHTANDPPSNSQLSFSFLVKENLSPTGESHNALHLKINGKCRSYFL